MDEPDGFYVPDEPLEDVIRAYNAAGPVRTTEAPEGSGRFVIMPATSGRGYRWELVDAAGTVIAVSPDVLVHKVAAHSGIRAVKRDAHTAAIEDLTEVHLR